MQKLVHGAYTYYVNGSDGKTELVEDPYQETVTFNIYAGEEEIGEIKEADYYYSSYYYLKDYLGSVKMILNSRGAVDSYNDYTPSGTQMPGRSRTSLADTRYKLTAKVTQR